MSQPGRFRYEYQVTYFYVSDIGLHARRYSDRIEAYSVSLKSGQAISGAVFELVDGAGKTLAKAQACLLYTSGPQAQRRRRLVVVLKGAAPT